jgi:hypothetical protein
MHDNVPEGVQYLPLRKGDKGQDRPSKRPPVWPTSMLLSGDKGQNNNLIPQALNAKYKGFFSLV